MRLAISGYTDGCLLNPGCRSAGEKATRTLAGCPGGGVGEDPVDPYLIDTLRGADWIGEGGGVNDGVGIEENKVGGEAVADQTALLELKSLRGHAGHFENGLRKGNELFLAAVPAQYARECSPQARMRTRIV